MQLILTALISGIVSLGGMFLAYNYVPLDAVSVNVPQNLGSTITTILGTDTLSSSRAVINTNFSNLNTDKLESGSTASTLTIGTLTLTNPLGVANGGTASTSISLNSVILGNGTSGFKTVTGHGVSGQFLTSGGAGAAPTWTTSAVDLAGNYGWTGNHNFAGTLTLIKNLVASSTVANPITLNGVGYAFPTSLTATSTSNPCPIYLTGGGASNQLYWNTNGCVIGSGSPMNGTSATATTSLATVIVPTASLSRGGTMLDITAFWELSNGDSCGIQIDYGTGTATTTFIQYATLNSGYQHSHVVGSITATSSVGTVGNFMYVPVAIAGAASQSPRTYGNVGAINTTGITYVSFGARSNGGGNTCTLASYSVRVNRQ